MASDIARLGRAGVAGLPRSKSQAQIFLQRSLCLRQRRLVPGQGGLSELRRRARGRRGGGFEYHASILPEPARVAIYQHELQFAAGPAGDVPPAASSPLETAAAPGRDLSGAQRSIPPSPPPVSSPISKNGAGASPRAALELFEMPRWARRTAYARAAVLDALAHFAAAVNAATATSPLILARFAESYNSGHIIVPASGAHSGAERAGESVRCVQSRGKRLCGCCPHPRAPGALALSLDRERDLGKQGDKDAHSLIPQVSAPTILRWHRLRARGGLAALAPRYGNRRGSGILDTNPAVRELVLAMIARYGKHLRAPRVAEAIRAVILERSEGHPPLRGAATLCEGDRTIPSLSTIRVFLRRWHRENASLSEAINNPDRWKGKYRIKIAKADEAIVRLNQEWQIDGTPADVMLISDNLQGRSPHLDVAGGTLGELASRANESARCAAERSEATKGVDPLRGFTSEHLKLKRFLYPCPYRCLLAARDVSGRAVGRRRAGRAPDFARDACLGRAGNNPRR